MWLIGASSGIGAALAPRLAREGAILALSARREDELRAVAVACPGDVRPLVVPLDVRDKGRVDAAYAGGKGCRPDRVSMPLSAGGVFRH